MSKKTPAIESRARGMRSPVSGAGHGAAWQRRRHAPRSARDAALVLNDAARSADAVGQLLEGGFLRSRFVVALRLRVGGSGRTECVRMLMKIRYPRIHDVGSLYEAQARLCRCRHRSNAHAMAPSIACADRSAAGFLLQPGPNG